MSLETLRESALASAIAVGRSFHTPDEDWDPVLLAEDASGRVSIVGIDPRHLSSEEAKDVLAYQVLPGLIRRLDAQALVLVHSAWVVERPSRDDLKGRVREQPDRREWLMVQVVDLLHHEVWHAPISRDGQGGPTLGEWESERGVKAAGRFWDPLRIALAENFARKMAR